MNIIELIKNLRGPPPSKCDWCEKETPTDFLTPSSVGEWVCPKCMGYLDSRQIVVAVCTAYEQGMGKGISDHSAPNPYAEKDYNGMTRLAWGIGFEEGKCKVKKCERCDGEGRIATQSFGNRDGLIWMTCPVCRGKKVLSK